MIPSRLTALVALGVSLSVPVPAHAQPLFGDAESIESTVANADRVVVGRIVAFLGGGRADGRTGREATIAVEETLKVDILQDEHDPRVAAYLPHPAATLAQWKDQGHRLLVAEQEDAPTTTTVIDLEAENLAVLSADFTLLRHSDDVIRVARETVRRMPAAVRRVHTFRLAVPRAAIAGTAWEDYYGTGGHLVLSVPVDERLEKRALDALRSDSYSRRREGVRALRYFRSDENIVRVKPLLDDPEWAYAGRAEENRGIEVRLHGVRQEAYRTLKSWGVTVDQPVIREEIARLERVKVADLSNRPVTDAELEDLARFANLEDVYLRNAPITDARLKALGGLRNLRALSLGGTRVTDAGLKELGGFPRLQDLDLGGTAVTDSGLKELAKFPGLRHLDLRGARVTDAGVVALRGLRPDLEIER